MTAFDELKRCEFSGIPFPIFEVRIEGALRFHVHEYPHSPGGAAEKLGRRLYEITVRAPFLQNLINKKWDNLWPGDLSGLRALFEDQVTADLHIPTIGTIRAYCTNWTEVMDAKIRSGVVMEFKFLEDQESAFLVLESITVSPRALESKLAALSLNVEQMRELATPDEQAQLDIFDQIDEVGNAIFGFRDQFELAGNLAEAKIRGLIALCNEADRTLDFLDDPVNYRVLDALHELWFATVQLQQNVQEKLAPLRTFTTSLETTITDIANEIYGDTERAADLLKLNAIDDAFAIPANTVIRYYDTATQQAA